jgi:hypothetical protein
MWPRAELAAVLKPLSHMLINGFFLSQGLFICTFLNASPRHGQGFDPIDIAVPEA